MFLQLLINVDDMLQLLQEPLVDLGQLVNTVDGVFGKMHRLRDDEDALVGRLAKSRINVGNLQLLVLYEAVHALAYHAQAFLYGFLKRASDGHHLANRLHRRSQLFVDAVELGQIPTWNLANHIVEGRLKEGARGLGHAVLQFKEPVAHTQLGGHESQGIASGLGRQGRRAAQAGIDLDDAIVL